MAGAPLLLGLAAWVKWGGSWSSPGPAFYAQTRLGRGGRRYRMYKLRTMVHAAEAGTGPVWASLGGDVRVTRLGRRVFSDAYVKGMDPSGRKYYWIGGGSIEWAAEEGTDFHAIDAGYVSVTPLHLDLTSHALIEGVGGWGLTG